MNLPVNPPVLPMLAKRVGELPEARDWIFEPKWDGFRALVFRDGDEIFIQSRDEKPLNRYFPELLEPLRRQLPGALRARRRDRDRTEHGLDFEALQLRLHPAASRVKMLAAEIPASVVFFDLLCARRRGLCERRRSQSARARLERCWRASAPPLHLTPATTRSRDSPPTGSAASRARGSTA